MSIKLILQLHKSRHIFRFNEINSLNSETLKFYHLILFNNEKSSCVYAFKWSSIPNEDEQGRW